MENADFAAAVLLKAQLAAIDTVQAKIAVTGTKVRLIVTDANGNPTVEEVMLKKALGDTAYAALIATVKTSLSTALTNEETTQQAAFDDLGT